MHLSMVFKRSRADLGLVGGCDIPPAEWEVAAAQVQVGGSAEWTIS